MRFWYWHPTGDCSKRAASGYIVSTWSLQEPSSNCSSTAFRTGQPLNLRRHEGFDHGYYFIATFMADHIAHHAKFLNA